MIQTKIKFILMLVILFSIGCSDLSEKSSSNYSDLISESVSIMENIKKEKYDFLAYNNALVILQSNIIEIEKQTKIESSACFCDIFVYEYKDFMKDKNRWDAYFKR